MRIEVEGSGVSGWDTCRERWLLGLLRVSGFRASAKAFAYYPLVDRTLF